MSLKDRTKVGDIKVGDKVKIKYDTAGSTLIGKIGTVVSIIPWKSYPVIVKFDNAITSKFLSTSPFEKNTRQFSYSEIEKVTNQSSVYDLKVIVNNDAVIAILKDGNTTKKGVAKCHPEDEFDMHTGLQIALSRLFDKPMPLMDGSELKEVHLHRVVNDKGLRQSMELKTETNTYVMPVKVEL